MKLFAALLALSSAFFAPANGQASDCEVKINVCVAIDNSGSICTNSGLSPRLCSSCESQCREGGPPDGNSDLCCANYEGVTDYAVNLITDTDIIDTVSAVKYGSTASVVSPQGSPADIVAIQNSQYTGGYTNTEAAITECKKELEGKEHPYIILITDGTPTACNRENGFATSVGSRDRNCVLGNCPECPNGDPRVAANLLADQSAADGITIIPVVASSVSSDIEFLEDLARCPDGSTECDVDDLKNIQVDSVGEIGDLETMIVDVITEITCPVPETAAPTSEPTKVPTPPPTNEPTESPTLAPTECDVNINVCVAIDNSGSICTNENLSPRLCTGCESQCRAGGPPDGNSDLCCANYEGVTDYAIDLITDTDIIDTVSAVKYGSTASVVSTQGSPADTIVAIQNSPYTGGYTNTEAAIFECKKLLDGKEHPYIILITDGTPTACNRENGFATSVGSRDRNCVLGNCPECPNGDPRVAANLLADQSAADGITIIPVVASSVSSDIEFLEDLARCPDGSTNCDVEEFKNIQVDNVGDIGELSTMIVDVISEIRCPEDPTDAPTKSPVPPQCEDDVEILAIDGVTDLPSGVVEIISQDTSTVDVRLTNGWTSEGDALDSIFYNYKINGFDDKCFEKEDVDGGDHYAEITIQCLHTEPYARLEICVADDGGALAEGDDAEVPQCCEPDLEPSTPVVCYKLLVWCETQCVDGVVGRRALRGADLPF